jgi:16S rRNA (uracil1498-N3)-methyltransferase
VNVFIGQFNNEYVSLRLDECWHCCKVLRKKVGDPIIVIDGKGKMAKAEITFISEKKCDAKVTETINVGASSKSKLHLAIAPTKQIDRIEWMVEKAVEIGINEISFIKCKNSERVNLNKERIEKIVESAVKQSLQAVIPKVNDLIQFDLFISNVAKNQLCLIAHCEEGEKLSLKSLEPNQGPVLVCIGPEGDFTLPEINLALSNGFIALSLGTNRLRTETAGLYAVISIQQLNF